MDQLKACIEFVEVQMFCRWREALTDPDYSCELVDGACREVPR